MCKKLNISFSEKMLSWPKGKRESDGIWEKVWYQNVQSSTSFKNLNKSNNEVPIKYKSIYLECLDIYKHLNNHNVLYE